MSLVELCQDQCPYCGEPIEMLVDCSVLDQEYTEDCSVCCRPIIVSVQVEPQEDGSNQVGMILRSENE